MTIGFVVGSRAIITKSLEPLTYAYSLRLIDTTP